MTQPSERALEAAQRWIDGHHTLLDWSERDSVPEMMLQRAIAELLDSFVKQERKVSR